MSRRAKHLTVTATVFLAEALIATTFARVGFVRSYLSDFLAVVFLYHLAKAGWTDVVLLERLAGRDATHAMRVPVHHLAIAGQQHDVAGVRTSVDGAVERRMQAIKSSGGKPGLRRLHGRQRPGGRSRSGTNRHGAYEQKRAQSE